MDKAEKKKIKELRKQRKEIKKMRATAKRLYVRNVITQKHYYDTVRPLRKAYRKKGSELYELSGSLK